MHELSIASSILNIAQEQLNKSGIDAHVEKVNFIAGKMHAIIPDSLRFHFDVIKKNNPLFIETELVIREVDVKVICPGCKREEVLSEPIFVCTGCGTPVNVIEGQEMRVESIDVADDEV